MLSQVLAIGLLALVPMAAASPVGLEPRETTCPSWSGIYPSRNQQGLCCVYSDALGNCCKTVPFDDVPFWKQVPTCDSEYFKTGEGFNHYYSCNTDPCRKNCANVPIITGKTCQKTN
ncbi:hypothetical protein MAPG_11179 [Magnaporthiopsis poae ATCC 64411]|uniref:Uncharacterized protein n=1 Tax=Magnaporthiopsis poae (strain ATCC 64411 / 73-15) TaxID=644358 RepID=A0A0C4EEK5_MAGP6|nr:hypothetical protein MAPG_11179 [Magnaporthiopsis poae ATCC 64411]